MEQQVIAQFQKSNRGPFGGRRGDLFRMSGLGGALCAAVLYKYSY